MKWKNSIDIKKTSINNAQDTQNIQNNKQEFLITLVFIFKFVLILLMYQPPQMHYSKISSLFIILNPSEFITNLLYLIFMKKSS